MGYMQVILASKCVSKSCINLCVDWKESILSRNWVEIQDWGKKKKALWKYLSLCMLPSVDTEDWNLVHCMQRHMSYVNGNSTIAIHKTADFPKLWSILETYLTPQLHEELCISRGTTWWRKERHRLSHTLQFWRHVLIREWESIIAAARPWGDTGREEVQEWILTLEADEPQIEVTMGREWFKELVEWKSCSYSTEYGQTGSKNLEEAVEWPVKGAAFPQKSWSWQVSKHIQASHLLNGELWSCAC